jgi:predicted DNA-binding transcriptional regulator AlpA
MAPRKPSEQCAEARYLGTDSTQQLASPTRTSLPTTSHQRHADRRSTDDPVSPRQYLTGPMVCARYSITDMSLWRWLHDAELRFPQPALRVKDRRYWLESDLITWERSQVPCRDEAVRDKRSKHRIAAEDSERTIIEKFAKRAAKAGA